MIETNLTSWLKENSNPNPAKRIPPKSELEEYYINQRLSTREIAKIYGVSQFPVRNWMKLYSIQGRSYKENRGPTPKGGTHSWGDKIAKKLVGNDNGGKGESHWHWQGGRPNCKVCDKPFTTYHPKHGMCIQCLGKTPERRKLLSEISPYKGKPAWNKGGSNWWQKGEKNNHWKGGVTPINEAIRRSPEYKAWRLAVFTRDGFKCVICCCGRSGQLEADHIKPFCLYIDLRFDINNGRTLCKACHLAHGWNYLKEVKHKKIDNLSKAP